MKAEGCEMPRRATVGSAGYDFFAPCDLSFEPGKWTEFDTGVSFDGTEELVKSSNGVYIMQEGQWFLMLVPKSGLGFKYGMRLANTLGCVDADYTSHIRAKFTCEKAFTLRKGDKYMQGIFMPYLTLYGEVKPTAERTGGFGSTGQ